MSAAVTSRPSRKAWGVPTPPAPRAYALICGRCGGEVAVPADCTDRQARCPHCLEDVACIRFVPHVCEHCAAKVSADLACCASVALCEQCGRPFAIGPVTAPPAHHRGHHHHRHGTGHPAAARDVPNLLVSSLLILLSAVAIMLLVLF